MAMKSISAIKSGFARTISAWKSIIIFWLISLIIAAMIVTPVRSGLKAALGKSLITDQLAQGINIEVIGDLGQATKTIASALSSGILMLLIVSVIVNIFLAGGVFDAVRKRNERPSGEDFFRACAGNFWSFAVIMLLFYLITIALLVVVVVVPVSMAANSENAPEGITFKMLRRSGVLFIALLAMVNLAADFARAWQAAHSGKAGIRAFGFGFGSTFRTFLSSFPLMLFIFILHAVTTLLIFRIVAGFAPAGAGGLILMFIMSQLTILLNVFIKVLRYASVTSLMEMIPKKSTQPVEIKDNKVVNQVQELLVEPNTETYG